jgi:hypothetical protein
MKLISNVGGVVSVILIAVGFFLLLKLGLFGKDLGICIVALVAAPTLSLGLYVFVLRQRIAALENRVRKLAHEERVPELT